jgi:hypothetical protein
MAAFHLLSRDRQPLGRANLRRAIGRCDVKAGVIAYRIAAHTADLAKGRAAAMEITQQVREHPAKLAEEERHNGMDEMSAKFGDVYVEEG